MKKKPRNICQNPECNNLTKRHTTKFCCRKCYIEYNVINNIHYGGPKTTKTLPRECLECKKIYKPCHKNQKYCSRNCMGMARRDFFIKKIKPLAYKNGITLETREKMSKVASLRNANRTYTKGIGGTRPDIGHYVRSRWEANFCRYLNYTKQKYKYEPLVFSLYKDNKTIRYRPDFLVNGTFIEIKGWWNEKSLLIKDLMEEQYPEITIKYIDEVVYKELEKEFKEKINEWEVK